MPNASIVIKILEVVYKFSVFQDFLELTRPVVLLKIKQKIVEKAVQSKF